MVEKGEAKNVNKIPLYIRIALALVLGVIVGMVLPNGWAEYFDIPARLILRVLGAIAPPLILVAVLQALIGAKAGEKLAGKMFFLLVLNTTVAIGLGIAVANAIRPGRHASLAAGDAPKLTGDPL
jgi:Na+/H+-dicarboxylate symporter